MFNILDMYHKDKIILYDDSCRICSAHTLLEILSMKMLVVKKIGEIKPIKWILYKLYKLISYNWRVIVSGNEKVNSISCAPDFSIKYRTIFLLVFMIFNTLMLFPLYDLVFVNSM